MLQWLYTYVANVSPQCFICFFQTYVSSVFHPAGCCICFKCVLHICCKCFIWTLLFFTMAANIFFLVFHTYIASVSYRYYKSRFGVAHVALEPICNSHLLQLLGLPAVRAQDTKWRRPRYGHLTQCGASTHMMQERASRRPDARRSGPICYRPY
jgi:hypothetical protein